MSTAAADPAAEVGRQLGASYERFVRLDEASIDAKGIKEKLRLQRDAQDEWRRTEALEAESGAKREDFGGEFYAPRELDPSVLEAAE